MSVELNPRDVLDILKSLGYEGITKDQLKLFMKDLKKLIKHDRRKQACKSKTDRGTSPLRFSEARPPPPADDFEEVTTGVRERYQRLMNDIHRMAPSPSPTQDKPSPVTDPDKLLDLVCSSCGGRLPQPAEPTSKEGSSSVETESSSCCCCRHRCTADPSAAPKKKDPPPPLKQCPSFIRSVKSANDRGGGGCGKSDPVSLYQHYQELWSRQNLPGENPRSDLRWRVRHKMMGPRPQWRSVASAAVRENPPWID